MKSLNLPQMPGTSMVRHSLRWGTVYGRITLLVFWVLIPGKEVYLVEQGCKRSVYLLLQLESLFFSIALQDSTIQLFRNKSLS